MKYIEYYQHYLAILLAFLQPLIIILYFGPIYSISMLWCTELQPLFIISNAITSFLFFCTKRWVVPSLFLLALTAFSVDIYPHLHTGIAYAFFVSCYFPMLLINRLRFYSYIYLISGVIGYFYGLFWLEVYGINILCAYHLHYLWHIQRIENN